MSKKNIRNMDTLEKEILRLKLHQKDTEYKLQRQLGKMRNNFGSIFMNSFKKKKAREDTEDNPGFFDSLFKSDKIEETLHKISEKISGKVSGVVSGLFEKFFKK